MSKVLDCTSLQTVVNSLKCILNVQHHDIVQFMKDNEYRISSSKYGSEFNRPDMNYIKRHFNFTSLDFDYIVVHHAAAVLNNGDSHLKYGMLNLKELAKNQDSDFTKFLKDFDIGFELNLDGEPNFIYKGKTISTEYIDYRIKKDQCINGFLFAYSVLEDTNISEIRSSPEIVNHLGRELKLDLRNQWIKKSVPKMISFKVNIKDLDSTTFPFAKDLSLKERREYFIQCALDYLLIIQGVQHQYPRDNPMIFLNESLNIPSESIVNICTLESLNN